MITFEATNIAQLGTTTIVGAARLDVFDRKLHERVNSQLAESEAILFKIWTLEKVVRNSNDDHLYTANSNTVSVGASVTLWRPASQTDPHSSIN